MEFYIGLDVSLKSTAICVLGPQGKIVQRSQAESKPEALVCAVKSLSYEAAAIGLEAGPLSRWLTKGAEESGQNVKLS